MFTPGAVEIGALHAAQDRARAINADRVEKGYTWLHIHADGRPEFLRPAAAKTRARRVKAAAIFFPLNTSDAIRFLASAILNGRAK